MPVINLQEEAYRAFPAVSQSDLRRYVQYSKFGERSTNYLAFKYPRPRKEPNDAMMVGIIVDGHFTENARVSFEDDRLIIKNDLTSLEEVYEMPDRRSSKSENKQISKSMGAQIKESIEALEQITEVMEVVNTSDKQLMLTDETLLELPIKGKIDLMHTPSKTVIDLKTSGTTIASFEKDFIFNNLPSVYHPYTRQLAFYRLLARQNGFEVEQTQILFVGMNTSDQAEVKVYSIPNSIIDTAEMMIRSDIEDLAKAIKDNAVATTFPEPTTSQTTNISLEHEQAVASLEIF